MCEIYQKRENKGTNNYVKNNSGRNKETFA